MVFSSSASSFLDPPINWPQSTNSNNHPNHSNQLQENGCVVGGHHQVISHHFPQNPNPNQHHVDNAGATIIDQASLNGQVAERARQAKNSQPPEGAQRCPRCDSANTKFCYFNNYNLTQPRHFCKACRRYWTRGGALRNVPVGGGCRRNKKGKSGNSKSSSSQSKQSNSVVNAPSPTTTSTVQLQANSQFPFFPSLQNLTQLGGIGLNLAAINGNNDGNSNASSSFLNDFGFFHGANTSTPVMGNKNNNETNIMTSLGLSRNFALYDRTTGLYNFPNEGNMGLSSVGSTRVSQTAPVKMEDNNVSNISLPVSGLTSLGDQSNQYWTGIGLPGSSSNDHHRHLM